MCKGRASKPFVGPQCTQTRRAKRWYESRTVHRDSRQPNAPQSPHSRPRRCPRATRPRVPRPRAPHPTVTRPTATRPAASRGEKDQPREPGAGAQDPRGASYSKADAGGQEAGGAEAACTGN
ncbi:hypothetical protein ON010_g410 [Phytophthora cinnamomi]|nr:hypothetical protein ON010_g410 [Phytophthora cinnamomi]